MALRSGLLIPCSNGRNWFRALLLTRTILGLTKYLHCIHQNIYRSNVRAFVSVFDSIGQSIYTKEHYNLKVLQQDYFLNSLRFFCFCYFDVFCKKTNNGISTYGVNNEHLQDRSFEKARWRMKNLTSERLFNFNPLLSSQKILTPLPGVFLSVCANYIFTAVKFK